jgi:cell division protein FtsB
VKKKQRSRRIRLIIILALVALPLFYFGRRVYHFIGAIREEHSLKKGILILRAENEVLVDRINQYKRSNLLEAKARDDLGMIRDSEKVYLVPKE